MYGNVETRDKELKNGEKEGKTVRSKPIVKHTDFIG
jgi:hypothetical protein